MKIKASLAMLRAVLLAAPKKDSRAYLNGVHVDPAGFLVATDGHRLHAVQVVVEDKGAAFTVPRDAVEQAVKLAGGSKASAADTVVEIAADTDGTVTLSVEGGGAIQARTFTNKYPDWQRVIPREVRDGTPGQFNADYLADAQKAFTILNRGRHVVPILRHDADNCGLVTSAAARGFFACVMPLRARDAGVPATDSGSAYAVALGGAA